MRHDIHIMFATSFSMVITFGFYCTIDKVTPRSSIFQIMCFDFFRDSFMLFRCLLFDRQSEEICERLLTPDTYIILYTVALITIYIGILCLFYGREMYRCIFIVVITMITVEYLARWFNGVDIYYKIDMMTVYLFIWQLTALVFRWMWRDLASSTLLIEQGSFCVFQGLEAFILHNIALRYLPIKINLAFLWLFSFIDIFVCLHHRGRLYTPSSNVRTLNSKDLDRPGTYYVGDANSGTITMIGLGDFFVYDTLLLLVLSPLSSMATKILVTLGCIVSVQIGYVGTRVLFSRLWANITVPALPLPIITFSIYFLILGIVTTQPSRCIQDSNPFT